MLKTLLTGIWVIAVALGANYFASNYYKPAGEKTETVADDGSITYIETDMFSVPMIKLGKISGYVVAQLSFAINKGEADKAKLDVKPFLMDAAFRIIYERNAIEFATLKPDDLTALSAAIAEAANNRIGAKVVKDVLVKEINYIPRNEVRTNWAKQTH